MMAKPIIRLLLFSMFLLPYLVRVSGQWFKSITNLSIAIVWRSRSRLFRVIRLAIVKKYRSRASEQEVVDQLAKLCWKIQDRRQAVVDRSRKDVRVLHVARMFQGGWGGCSWPSPLFSFVFQFSQMGMALGINFAFCERSRRITNRC